MDDINKTGEEKNFDLEAKFKEWDEKMEKRLSALEKEEKTKEPQEIEIPIPPVKKEEKTIEQETVNHHQQQTEEEKPKKRSFLKWLL